MSAGSFWAALEGIRGQAAVAADWRRWLGEEFAPIRDAFLQRCPEPAGTVPCSRGCGCRHEVVAEVDRLLGICRCDSWNCDDLVLTRDEVTVWELGRARLHRALANCLELDPARGVLGVPGTSQVGAWSSDAVPILLGIHTEAGQFRAALAEVVARLRRPFVLLAPTHAHLDAVAHELLANAQAAALALEATVSFDGCHLHAVRRPGELFARFTPQPADEPDESTARQAFALVQKLELRERQKPPSVLDVFRLYCIEQLGVRQIARRFDCSKGTVIGRLNLLKQRLGTSPAHLRRLSSHFAAIEQSASDSRARRINRRKLICEPEDEEA